MLKTASLKKPECHHTVGLFQSVMGLLILFYRQCW